MPGLWCLRSMLAVGGTQLIQQAHEQGMNTCFCHAGSIHE